MRTPRRAGAGLNSPEGEMRAFKAASSNPVSAASS